MLPAAARLTTGRGRHPGERDDVLAGCTGRGGGDDRDMRPQVDGIYRLRVTVLCSTYPVRPTAPYSRPSPLAL